MSEHQFELFRRPSQRTHELGVRIVPQHSVDGGQIGINAASWRQMRTAGMTHARLYYSPVTRTIGLKAADPGDLNAYKVTAHVRGTGAVISATRFLNHVGWIAQDRVTLLARWNSADQMLECELPAEFLKDSKVPRRSGAKSMSATGEGSG